MNKRLKKKKKTLPIKSIRKMEVLPGDILVVNCNDYLTCEAGDNISETMKDAFPDNKCIILTKGIELKIMHEEKGVVALDNPKYIRDWKELKEEKSPTHTLEIDTEGGYGWIIAKDGDAGNLKRKYYLSTHTFYGGSHAYSTALLQLCNFNVVLANWDEIGL